MEHLISLSFSNATELINYIYRNSDLIKKERIRKVYHTGACLWNKEKYSKMWTSDEGIVIEFNTFAILLEYFDVSDIKLTIIDNESLYNGRLELENPYGIFIPDEDNEIPDFNLFDSNITDIFIERFSHSFAIDPAGCEMSADGGDYFASIIVMMGDVGIYVCAEEALFDGYMDWGIIHRKDKENIKSGMDGVYEKIWS